MRVCSLLRAESIAKTVPLNLFVGAVPIELCCWGWVFSSVKISMASGLGLRKASFYMSCFLSMSSLDPSDGCQLLSTGAYARGQAISRRRAEYVGRQDLTTCSCKVGICKAQGQLETAKLVLRSMLVTLIVTALAMRCSRGGTAASLKALQCRRVWAGGHAAGWTAQLQMHVASTRYP